MVSLTMSLLAFVPLVLAGVLLIGFRVQARTAMPIVFIVTVLIALLAWDMSVTRVVASSLQGLMLTISILWIIFGAILIDNVAVLFEYGAIGVPCAACGLFRGRTVFRLSKSKANLAWDDIFGAV